MKKIKPCKLSQGLFSKVINKYCSNYLRIDNEVGGCTATGMGEEVLKLKHTFLVVELMRQGKSPQDACEEAIKRIVEKAGDRYTAFQVGLIAVNKQGEIGAYCIHKWFNYTVYADEKKISTIHQIFTSKHKLCRNAVHHIQRLLFLTSLFFLWGFITVLVDSLVPRIKDVFEMNYGRTILVQSAFFIAFFVISLPAGVLLTKIGYKKGIVLGLCIMACGCLLFYPASEYRNFMVFMMGYFTLASGITIIQVAANPYVALLGSEEGASSRLNLSQAF